MDFSCSLLVGLWFICDNFALMQYEWLGIERSRRTVSPSRNLFETLSKAPFLDTPASEQRGMQS